MRDSKTKTLDPELVPHPHRHNLLCIQPQQQILPRVNCKTTDQTIITALTTLLCRQCCREWFPQGYH